MNIEQFLNRIIKWSENQDSIVGLALVGSYAVDKADINSDIDLIIFCVDKRCYTKQHDWSYKFGDVLKKQKEYYGIVTSIRVWYKDRFEVEFGFTTQEWAEIPVDQGTRRVVEDGIRVLYDPAGFLLRLIKHLEEEDKC